MNCQLCNATLFSSEKHCITCRKSGLKLHSPLKIRTDVKLVPYYPSCPLVKVCGCRNGHEECGLCFNYTKFQLGHGGGATMVAQTARGCELSSLSATY